MEEGKNIGSRGEGVEGGENEERGRDGSQEEIKEEGGMGARRKHRKREECRREEICVVSGRDGGQEEYRKGEGMEAVLRKKLRGGMEARKKYRKREEWRQQET
jgi:hypothetical protein